MKDQEYELENAIIESVVLNDADRGLLTAWIYLKFNGCGQGFGGFSLYLPKTFKHHDLLSHAGHFIFRCMEIGGVSNWDDLVGKEVRVKHNHSEVYAIGHIIKDDWFCPKEDFKKQDKPSGILTLSLPSGEQWKGTPAHLQAVVEAHALLANMVNANEQNRPDVLDKYLQEAKELVRR